MAKKAVVHPSNDPIIQLLQRWKEPVTRENYLELAYPNGVSEWTGELEANLPEELQDWDEVPLEGAIPKHE